MVSTRGITSCQQCSKSQLLPQDADVIRDCCRSSHLSSHNQLSLVVSALSFTPTVSPITSMHRQKNLRAKIKKKSQTPRDPPGSLTIQQSPCKEAISYMLGLFPKLIALIYLTGICGQSTRHTKKASAELLQQHSFTREMWLMENLQK